MSIGASVTTHLVDLGFLSFGHVSLPISRRKTVPSMHKALLILGGIGQMASWVGDPARRLLEPRYLPYASWDLTDGNVEKFYGLRVGPLLISFASLD